MCAAARVDPATGSRCREHFRAACRAVARLGGMSNAKRCWAVWGPLIIAPKVHFLNSVLSEECPVCLYWRRRIDAAPLSGLDEACPGAERTPDSVQRCASPSLASLNRWR